MVSVLDVLHPRVVGRILCKVDDTLSVTVESVFLLLDPQFSHEVLHLDYFLVGFHNYHVLRFRC